MSARRRGEMNLRELRFLVILGMAFLLAFSKVSAQEAQRAARGGDSHVIEPEDRLEIHVWKESDLTREVLVRKDGMISMPLVDDVQAAGLTPMELKKVVTDKLKDFLSEPQVTVIVKEPRRLMIYILGNVNKPGTYDTVKEVTFLQAIAMAGGLNDWASNNIVLITREKGKDARRVINYKDVISGEALEHNVVLKSGDTIVVP